MATCFNAYYILQIDVWTVLSPSRGLYSFRAQDKAERLSPVDPGIIKGVTDDLYNTRNQSTTRSLQS